MSKMIILMMTFSIGAYSKCHHHQVPTYLMNVVNNSVRPLN